MMRSTPRFFAHLSLIAALLLAVVVLGAGSAGAFEITQPIPNSNQTACIDVKGADTASGTPIESYPCSGFFNEQWTLTGSGIEGIGTANGAVTLLCVPPGAQQLPLPVALEGCSADWVLMSNSQIEDTDVQGCLDSQGKYGSGAQAILAECSTSSSQSWVLKDIVIQQPIPNSIEQSCVDVRGNAIANHTPADAYPCTLGDNERWNFVKGRLQTMGTDKNALTCLGVTSGGKVELETCNDSPNQAWRIAAAGDIVNVGTNKCLDSMGKYGDVQLVIAPCKFNASQRWVLR